MNNVCYWNNIQTSKTYNIFFISVLKKYEWRNIRVNKSLLSQQNPYKLLGQYILFISHISSLKSENFQDLRPILGFRALCGKVYNFCHNQYRIRLQGKYFAVTPAAPAPALAPFLPHS
jgi:hypothetical protein